MIQDLTKCGVEPIGGTVNEHSYRAASAKADWQIRNSVTRRGWHIAGLEADYNVSYAPE